jgi:hypothetical protein
VEKRKSSFRFAFSEMHGVSWHSMHVRVMPATLNPKP